MISIWSVVAILALLVATVVATMMFCRQVIGEMAAWETDASREARGTIAAVLATYETLLEKVQAEAATNRKIPDIIEVVNLNTKSLDLVEKTLNQLTLRLVAGGFVDRSREKHRQVGEEGAETRIGNRTIVGAPSPNTRMDSGAEGFVDGTGAVLPVNSPTPREIAAMPPT